MSEQDEQIESFFENMNLNQKDNFKFRINDSFESSEEFHSYEKLDDLIRDNKIINFNLELGIIKWYNSKFIIMTSIENIYFVNNKFFDKIQYEEDIETFLFKKELENIKKINDLTSKKDFTNKFPDEITQEIKNYLGYQHLKPEFLTDFKVNTFQELFNLIKEKNYVVDIQNDIYSSVLWCKIFSVGNYSVKIRVFDFSEEIFVTDLVEINYKDIDYIDIQPHRSKFLSKCFEDFEKEDSINKALEMILPTYKFISNFYCEDTEYINYQNNYSLVEKDSGCEVPVSKKFLKKLVFLSENLDILKNLIIDNKSIIKNPKMKNILDYSDLVSKSCDEDNFKLKNIKTKEEISYDQLLVLGSNDQYLFAKDYSSCQDGYLMINKSEIIEEEQIYCTKFCRNRLKETLDPEILEIIKSNDNICDLIKGKIVYVQLKKYNPFYNTVKILADKLDEKVISGNQVFDYIFYNGIEFNISEINAIYFDSNDLKKKNKEFELIKDFRNLDNIKSLYNEIYKVCEKAANDFSIKNWYIYGLYFRYFKEGSSVKILDRFNKNAIEIDFFVTTDFKISEVDFYDWYN